MCECMSFPQGSNKVLLTYLLKDVCNISHNKFALQIRKKIYIFFSMFYFRAFILLGLSLHAVPLTN